MNFQRVLIIENSSKGSNIAFNSNNLYAGPMNILDIEYHENYLEKMGVPYILAECETTVDTTDSKGIRFSKGYCLFTKTYKERI